MLTVYHNDMSSCSQKVRFVLAEKAVPWESVTLDLRVGDQFRPEFLKLNPKGLVPVIDHDGEVIAESNVIIEYLNDVFPQRPLLPADAVGRARARGWMKKLDDGLHLEVAALSVGIAFRHQIMAVKNTPELLAAHFAAIPDPYMREVQRQVVTEGAGSPRVAQAVKEFRKLFEALEPELARHDWIVGDTLTLADIAYAPYITRLDHLALEGLWADKPHVAAWYERLKATTGYQEGLARWFNPKYLPLMREAGLAAAASIRLTG